MNVGRIHCYNNLWLLSVAPLQCHVLPDTSPGGGACNGTLRAAKCTWAVQRTPTEGEGLFIRVRELHEFR